MIYEKFRALQWSTSGTETKKVLRNLDKHLSGIDVVTLQELQGTNIYDNQAKDIAVKLGFNHKFLPNSDTPNNGVAILSPHELWFPEQYEVPGLIRSLKADLRQRHGHPRITVVTTHINPDQIFDHPSPLSEEHQSLQKAVNRGLKPSNLDQDYYLVLGNFGPPYPNLKQLKSIYQFMIPLELSEPFTKKPGEESTTHLLYVDWRGQRLGLEHLRTELYPTRFTHPILRAELNVELPDLHQQLSDDSTPPQDYAKLMRLVHPWPDMPPRSS